jgi:NADH-quinone oxidoreductase subunit C
VAPAAIGTRLNPRFRPAVESLEQIRKRIRTALPGADVIVVPNPSPANQPSLRVKRADALAVSRFLRDDPALRFDYVSNVTGVDWLDWTHREKVRVLRVVEGVEREFLDEMEFKRPGRLEVVYHLYSMALKHGPLVLRLRTDDRSDRNHVPSLTPIWRGCELQEREVYDLFGVIFDGHPDLRRILMWEGFLDHPMRKDYVDPDDYEYEPTAHDAVLERARARERPRP